MNPETIANNIINGNISLAKEELKKAKKVEVLAVLCALNLNGTPYHEGIAKLINYLGGF